MSGSKDGTRDNAPGREREQAVLPVRASPGPDRRGRRRSSRSSSTSGDRSSCRGPRGGGGSCSRSSGAVALTLAVSLFLKEWFGFAGREVRKVRLAARDFLFLCSLALLLFFSAKAVLEILAETPALKGLVGPQGVRLPDPAPRLRDGGAGPHQLGDLHPVHRRRIGPFRRRRVGALAGASVPPAFGDRGRFPRREDRGPVRDAPGGRADRPRLRPRRDGARVRLPRRRGAAARPPCSGR